MADTVVPAPLALGTRTRLRVRHGARLVREVGRYGAEQRLWWLVPVVVLLMLAAMALTATSTTLPVAVYTLF